MCAALIRIAERWNALNFTFDEPAQILGFAMILNTMLSKYELLSKPTGNLMP